MVYGGWGFDLIDLRASTVVDNGLNDIPVPNSHGGAGAPDWEALAYGGPRQDTFFGRTGGGPPNGLGRNPHNYPRPLPPIWMAALGPTPMTIPPHAPSTPAPNERPR